MPKSITHMPEIETKLLLTTIGIDSTEDGYILSATAVMPKESHDGATMRLSVNGDGASISEALDVLSAKMGKQLELGLCGLVIVGNTFLGKDIMPHLEYLLSSGKVIPGAHLCYAPNKSAKETIELSNMLSEATSNGLSKLIEHNQATTNMPAVTLHKFLSQTHGVSKCSYMPCLSLSEKKDELPKTNSSGGEQNPNPSSGSGSGKESQIDDMEKIMIFKDGYTQVELDTAETRGYTWMDNDSTKGLITVNDFTVKGNNVGNIYCQILDKKYTLRTEIEKDEIKAKIKVKAMLGFEDRHKLSNLFKSKEVSEKELNFELFSQVAKKIEEQIKSVVDVMQRSNLDAIGLEDNVYRYSHKAYKRHDKKGEIIKHAKIEYDIDVSFK